MPIEWPSDVGVFAMVAGDLAPLMEAYPDGTLAVPDGFEDLVDSPVSNGITSAVPWQYTAPATVSQRGRPNARTIVILGVTMVQDDGVNTQFRRFVDWAGVWAQLGKSEGRPEFDEQEQTFLLPDGRETDPLIARPQSG